MFLTVKETAELLRVSQRHVYKLVKNKEIPSIRLKGKILVDKDELLTKLKEV